jgi:hypothetical protein
LPIEKAAGGPVSPAIFSTHGAHPAQEKLHMAMTFDATLKDMGRESPTGFLAAFDRPPVGQVSLLNVDLSTVTASTDLILGLGQPLEEIVQIDFQSSAAAWKHANLMLYNALLYEHYHVPVHSILILLRPEAAHRNANGAIHYAPWPERGSMAFNYEVVRLWERPVEELLAGDVGVSPLAMLGRLPKGLSIRGGIGGRCPSSRRTACERSSARSRQKAADGRSAVDGFTSAPRGCRQDFSRSSCHARIRHLFDDSR